LTPFQQDEMGQIAASIKLGSECVLSWIEKGIDQAMNEFNKEYQYANRDRNKKRLKLLKSLNCSQ